MKTRIMEIDIIKGLAIILMVYGHTFGILHDWVYLFHMPVFFMVSGFCWRKKHVESPNLARKYVFDRTIRLMIPYMTCAIIYVLLNNLFIKINFYTTNPEILTLNGSIPHNQKISAYFGFTETLQKIYQVLCFDYQPQMGGALWFLYALAFICLIHCGIEFLLNKETDKRIRTLFFIILFAFLIIMSWDVMDLSSPFRNIMVSRHYRLFACYLAFLLGIGAQMIGEKAFGLWQGAVGFVSLCILSRFGTLELSTGEIVNPGYYILCSIAGWMFLGSVAKFLVKVKANGVFEYIGRHTLPIVFLHLLVFKVVSWIYVILHNEPLYRIAMFPVIFESPEWVKLIYTIVAVSVSLVIAWLFGLLKGKISWLPEKKWIWITGLSLTILIVCTVGVTTKQTITSADIEKNGNVGAITGTKTIGQEIEIDSDLSAFSLYFATYNRLNDCELNVSINSEGVMIQQWTIDCSELLDNSYYRFTLNEQIISGRYEITVYSNGTEENAVTIYKNDSGLYSGLSVNGEKKLDESLCYRLETQKDASFDIRGIMIRMVTVLLIYALLYIGFQRKNSN